MTENNDNLFNYPTKAEYILKKHKIQTDELNSERFKKVCTFLSANYWSRFGIVLEDDLFEIIEKEGNEDELSNKSIEYRQEQRVKKYGELKDFLNFLTKKQIESNIFLKMASKYMKTSFEDCTTIFTQLFNQISNSVSENTDTTFEIKWDIPESRNCIFKEEINENIGIKYYRSEDYRISYVGVLDAEHKYIYEDYNDCVRKLKILAEDIYLLMMNMITNMYPNQVFINYFNICIPDKKFIISFTVKPKNKEIYDIETIIKKLENESLFELQSNQNEENFLTEEFIKTTIENYQKLLDLGIIDETELDKNKVVLVKK